MFQELPSDLQLVIAKLLPTSDLINVTRCSNKEYKFFKQISDLAKFLYHVTHRDRAVVKAMLEKNPDLMVQRGRVTDCSGRTFESVSGFEYALWALDKHFWIEMINCLPDTDKGKEIKTILCEQYQKVKKTGLTYQSNSGKFITEKHFDFEGTIIQALQTQIDLEFEVKKAREHFKNDVGSSQHLLPMHVVHELCSICYPNSSDFTQEPEPTQKYYNRITSTFENWFAISPQLGVNGAAYCITEKYFHDSDGNVGLDGNHLGIIKHQLMLVKNLYTKRAQEFIDLELELNAKKEMGHHSPSMP